MPLQRTIINMVEHLNQEQLHELYNIIRERLQLFHKAQALYQIYKFKVLDKIYFDYHGERKEGVVMRLNQKTVSIVLITGEHWNVSPSLLKKIEENNPAKVKG